MHFTLIFSDEFLQYCEVIIIHFKIPPHRWKNTAAKAGDVCLLPESGRFPGGGSDNPLQYSGLGNPMYRGAWQATVLGGHKKVQHGLVTKQEQSC